MTFEAPLIPVLTSIAELSSARRAWLCDIWGVLHNGVTAFEDASDACRRFRAQGGVVVLISNSPRPAPGVIQQLAGFGIGPDVFDAVVTSGDVTVELIRQRMGEPMFHLGPERDKGMFDAVTVNLVTEGEARVLICTGLYHDEEETAEDYIPLLSRFAARGVPMICGNPDKLVEKGHRLIPCAGALADIYEGMGQTVIYAGKPHRPIYDLAVSRLRSTPAEGAALAEVLAIGDGLHTDIAGAAACGIDAVFIASRVHLGSETGLTHPALQALFRDVPRRPVAAMARLAW
jgi:HAD superfamily hydrolase (TIGR01459 family)